MLALEVQAKMINKSHSFVFQTLEYETELGKASQGNANVSAVSVWEQHSVAWTARPAVSRASGSAQLLS